MAIKENITMVFTKKEAELLQEAISERIGTLDSLISKLLSEKQSDAVRPVKVQVDALNAISEKLENK